MFRAVIAILVVQLTLMSEVVAGPPEEGKPLLMLGPAAAADEAPHAFFYNGGKKVFLTNTDLAVAKVAGEAPLDESPVRAVRLAPGNALQTLQRSMARERLVIVGTTGPSAMKLAAAEDNIAGVDYVLPIVRDAAAANEDDYMVLTPRISARFTETLTDSDDVADYIEPFGLRIKRKSSVPNTYVLELADGLVTYTRLLKAANALFERGAAEKKVIESFPDFIPTKKSFAVNDPRIGDQWHLQNTSQGGGVSGADAKVVEAWQVTMGDPGIRIAIIDDSVEKAHPDLADNYIAGRYYNGFTGEFEDDPSPHNGGERHGTSCAGVACAAANDIGGRGAAPGCGLIGVHIWDASAAQTAEAFYYCAEQDAAVISCSWSWQSRQVFSAVAAAINDVAVNKRQGKGIVVLFAAGNEYDEIDDNQWFAELPTVICVGATNWRDDHSAYSNHGPELDVVAPSSDSDTRGALSIETTDNTDGMPKIPGRAYAGYALGDYTGNGDTGFGGTSSATPLVAGVCGLILSVNPHLTAQQLRDVLLATADKVPGVGTPANYDLASGHSLFYGYGRVNAKRAVERASAILAGPQPELRRVSR
jgi:subtilisin family serine protease